MRDSWTDERLDDGFRRVDDGFRRVDESFRRVDEDLRSLRGEMNARFEQVDARFDAMQRTMIHGFIALSAAIVAGFGGMAGLIATQL